MADTKIPGAITSLLIELTQNLANWLQENLSKVDSDWWSSLVIPSLSYQQVQHVKNGDIESLDKLDLAALLRIMDKNWYQLSQKTRLTTQDRNYLKEMATVRNRWAHYDASGVDADTTYRDLDTIQRLSEVLGHQPKDIAQLKSSVLSRSRDEAEVTPKQDDTPDTLRPAEATDSAPIEIGTVVSLVSDPSKKGAVISIDERDGRMQYTVFLDGEPRLFYASQIQSEVKDRVCQYVPIKHVQNLLTAIQIKHPSLSNLYSLNSARIDFVPYQFRPALKIIRSDRPRLLVADGVGVGKTIEAGLILRELQARSDLRSVLIICPKPLISERKWELEMRRFDEKFMPLDGKTLQYCIDETDLEGEWPEKYEKAILPYSLLDENRIHGTSTGKKKRKGLLDLDPPPHFDLVIVDEAHHIKNANTFSHGAVRFFCDNADAVVFLTATPIQLGNRDLYTLLNVLRPDLVIDEDTFQHMSEPNPHINRALRYIRAGGENWQEEALSALTDASQTAWGQSLLATNPTYLETCEQLGNGALTREDRVSISGEVESLHSFSRIINRTRRRDIGDFCLRKPETVEVCFTPDQKQLYEQLLDFERETLSMQHGDQHIPFMMTTIRRQAASSIFGLAPFIADILERRLSEIEVLACEGDVEQVGELSVDTELRERAARICELAEQLSEEDPKFDALFEIVQQKQSFPNNKLIVFSTFRHTLAYLRRRLIEAEVRVGLVHGGVEDEERQKLRKRFETSRDQEEAIDVLLFSEIGCEGLDYQFCDGMVNYDLPWNPMKIEQRIGRIDRRGQKSEAVAIYNLITAETIDADIYHRCLWRIGVFEASIGECEEILGSINQESIASIANNFSLTDDERRQKLEQLADNEIRGVQEQQRLEDDQHVLFGLNLPSFALDEEIQKSESFWLTPQSIERFVSSYLQSRCGKNSPGLGEKPLKTLRLSQEARGRLFEDFDRLKSDKTPMYRMWQKWLKGNEQQCSVTFDSECAATHRNAHFVMPIHPLVRQAANSLDLSQPVYVKLQVSTSDFQPGDYPFGVYAWEYKGVRSEIKLIPICSCKELAEEVFTFLESGIDVSAESKKPSPETYHDLDGEHYRTWQESLAKHTEKTREICDFRRESLEQSHAARLNVVGDQLDKATNENIIRMKEAELQNMRKAHEEKLAEIAAAQQTADIHSRPVLFGVVTVRD